MHWYALMFSWLFINHSVMSYADTLIHTHTDINITYTFFKLWMYSNIFWFFQLIWPELSDRSCYHHDHQWKFWSSYVLSLLTIEAFYENQMCVMSRLMLILTALICNTKCSLVDIKTWLLIIIALGFGRYTLVDQKYYTFILFP